MTVIENCDLQKLLVKLYFKMVLKSIFVLLLKLEDLKCIFLTLKNIKVLVKKIR